tara:strand:+ start:162 stop:842 length:681 start_codon:yes stop_codon:yes gene_type:complete
MHPRLDYDLYHERPKRFLSCSTAKEALKKMRKPCTQGGETIGSEMSIESGIKVAYTKAKLALEVINRFLWMFPQGSIVHAIRTPADCISSQMRTFDRPFDRCLTMYFDSVPIVRKRLYKLRFGTPMRPFKSTLRVQNVIYGQFMYDSFAHLHNLYHWMGGGPVDAKHTKIVLSTKDPWDYDGRIMCGLRYFKEVRPQGSKMVLNKKQQKAVQHAAEKTLYGRPEIQ